MALRFLDSFDHYTTVLQKWTLSTSGGNAPSIAAGAARTGAAGIQFALSSNPSTITLTLDQQQTWIIGFAFKTGGNTSNQDILRTLDGGSEQGSLRFNTDGTFSLTRNGTVVATSTRAVSSGTYYFLEFTHTIAGAGGRLELRINGVVAATFTGNTQATGNAYANGISFGWFGGNAGGNYLNMDDIYILDGTGGAPNNAYWGDTAIYALLPNGAGNYTNWATLVGAATHWQAVNEVPPNDDTSYVADNGAGDNDSYTFADLPITSAIINGIQVDIRAREDNVGGTQIKRLYRNSATDNLGATLVLSVSYQYFLEIMATDPIAAAAWSVSTINSAEFGAQVQ